MPFQKGHKLSRGRPKGVLNNPEVASLKVLLADAFLRNRSAAIAKIDSMFTSSDLTDFKWLCQLKAMMEPRQATIEHKGEINFTSVIEEVSRYEQIEIQPPTN